MPLGSEARWSSVLDFLGHEGMNPSGKGEQGMGVTSHDRHLRRKEAHVLSTFLVFLVPSAAPNGTGRVKGRTTGEVASRNLIILSASHGIMWSTGQIGSSMFQKGHRGSEMCPRGVISHRGW